MSDVSVSICLSVTYLRPKSKMERLMKTKIGTKIAHITRDSDTSFNVKSLTCTSWGHIVAASDTAYYRLDHTTTRIWST